MQVRADWHGRWTSEEAESELSNFEFKGAGLYMTNTDTIIVVPSVENSNWLTKTTHYWFYGYNCPYSETIFAKLGDMPTRKDVRE